MPKRPIKSRCWLTRESRMLTYGASGCGGNLDTLVWKVAASAPERLDALGRVMQLIERIKEVRRAADR